MFWNGAEGTGLLGDQTQRGLVGAGSGDRGRWGRAERTALASAARCRQDSPEARFLPLKPRPRLPTDRAMGVTQQGRGRFAPGSSDSGGRGAGAAGLPQGPGHSGMGARDPLW